MRAVTQATPQRLEGKHWPIGMSLWGGGALILGSITSWSQKMRKIRRRLEMNLNLVPR